MKTAAKEQPAMVGEDMDRIPDGSQHDKAFDESRKDTEFSCREAMTGGENDDFDGDLHEPCLRFQK